MGNFVSQDHLVIGLVSIAIVAVCAVFVIDIMKLISRKKK